MQIESKIVIRWQIIDIKVTLPPKLYIRVKENSIFFHYFLFETYQVANFVGEIGINRNYKLWAFIWYQICVAVVASFFKVKSANLYETTIKHEFLTGSCANFGIAMYYLVPLSYMLKGPHIWYRMKGKCVF